MRQSGRRRRRGQAKALLWFAAVCGFGLAVVVFLGREAAPGKGSVRVAAVEQAAAPELREQAGTGGATAELQFATAAQRRAYERELFAAVRAIPAAQLEENRDA